MKVTFTIKDLCPSLLERLDGMDNAARWGQLKKWAQGDLKHLVKMKIGNGQFNQAVDLNVLVKRGGVIQDYELAPRRGYKLATFTWGRAL